MPRGLGVAFSSCGPVNALMWIRACLCLCFCAIRARCERRTVQVWVWWAGGSRSPGELKRWDPSPVGNPASALIAAFYFASSGMLFQCEFIVLDIVYQDQLLPPAGRFQARSDDFLKSPQTQLAFHTLWIYRPDVSAVIVVVFIYFWLFKWAEALLHWSGSTPPPPPPPPPGNGLTWQHHHTHLESVLAEDVPAAASYLQEPVCEEPAQVALHAPEIWL